jgi:hypothetical protein
LFLGNGDPAPSNIISQETGEEFSSYQLLVQVDHFLNNEVVRLGLVGWEVDRSSVKWDDVHPTKEVKNGLGRCLRLIEGDFDTLKFFCQQRERGEWGDTKEPPPGLV